jgi:hypothetical protein
VGKDFIAQFLVFAHAHGINGHDRLDHQGLGNQRHYNDLWLRETDIHQASMQIRAQRVGGKVLLPQPRGQLRNTCGGMPSHAL